MLKIPTAILALSIFFINSVIGPLPSAIADEFRLPLPGVMVHISPPQDPPMLKGIKVHPDDPLRFDFILDRGDSVKRPDSFEATKLIKYFLASLTIPEEDLWVNLSPYEKNRIIPNSFGLTEMGRDLLAEDYMLKQITASLIYPEGGVGKKFWQRIYEVATKRYGTTNIPVNTFNKVWIVPDKAVVYENARTATAYIIDSKLKVMLERDYLASQKHAIISNDMGSIGANTVREIVIPELTKEVNEGKNFAQLRQVYNSLILATWYKKKIKDSILAQAYADKNKIAGLRYSNSLNIASIYQRYLQAFKKGVYNYIKEEIDPLTQQPIPRKYFSGGMELTLTWNADGAMRVVHDKAMVEAVGKENAVGQYKVSVDMDRILAKQMGPVTVPQFRTFLKKEGLPNVERWTITRYLQRKNMFKGAFDQEKIKNRRKVELRFLEEMEGKATVLQIIEFLSANGFPDVTKDDIKNDFRDSRLEKYKDLLIVKKVKKVNRGLVAERREALINILMGLKKPETAHGLMARLKEDKRFLDVKLDDVKNDLRRDKRLKNLNWMRRILNNEYPQDPKELARIMGALKGYAIKNRLIEMSRVDLNQLSDFVNEVFLIVLQNVSNYRGDSPPFNYFLGVARNLKNGTIGDIVKAREVIDEKSSSELERLPAAGLTHDYFPNGFDLINNAEQLQILNQGLGALSQPDREVLERILLKGYDVQAEANLRIETIDPEGLSPEEIYKKAYLQARNAQSRARAKLRDIISDIEKKRLDSIKGGIDLTPANMNLQAQNKGGEIKFHLDPAKLRQLQNAPGFYPKVISIEPLGSLLQFLGIDPSVSISMKTP